MRLLALPTGWVKIAPVKHIAWHRGIEVCRTSAGHLIVLDPRDTREDRARLVQLLADAEELDALFFPSVGEARAAIEDYIAEWLPQSR